MRLTIFSIFSIFILSCRPQFTEQSQILGGGVEDGNAGDIIVCDAPQSEFADKKAIFFDRYFAKQHFKTTVLGDLDEPWLIKAKRILQGIKILDPTRHKTYQRYLDNFKSEMKISSKLVIPKVVNSAVIDLPDIESCEVTNVVYQQTPIFDFDKRYNIEQSLWELLDNNDKASLALHEIIFREARMFGHKVSRLVVYFNAMLLSDQFKEMSRKQYASLLTEKVQLQAVYQFDTFFLDVGTVNIENDVATGKVRVGKVLGDDDNFIDLPTGAFGHPLVKIGDNAVGVAAGSRVSVDLGSAKVSSIEGQISKTNKYVLASGCAIDLPQTTFVFDAIKIYLHNNIVEELSFTKDTSGIVDLPDCIWLNRRYQNVAVIQKIRFFESGQPKEITVGREIGLTNKSGLDVHFKSGEKVAFDTDGWVN